MRNEPDQNGPNLFWVYNSKSSFILWAFLEMYQYSKFAIIGEFAGEHEQVMAEKTVEEVKEKLHKKSFVCYDAELGVNGVHIQIDNSDCISQ